MPTAFLLITLMIAFAGCQRQSPPLNPEGASRVAVAPATSPNEVSPEQDNESRNSTLSLHTASEWHEVFEQADVFDDGMPMLLNKIYSPTQRRLLLLLDRSPWLVDLELFDNGQSIEYSWHDAAAAICRGSDSDGDGKTTWLELVSNEELPITTDNPKSHGDLTMVTSAYDANSNGQVEPPELVRFVNRNAGGQGFITTATGSSRAQTQQEVFDRLDRNNDKAIDQAELQNCGQQLTMRDANGDGLLSRADFETVNNGMVMTRARPYASNLSEPQIFVMQSGDLLDDASSLRPTTNEWESILYALEKSYAYGDPLSVGDLPSTFADLDGNADGYIDAIEIPRISEMAPHVVLRIEFRTGASPHVSINSGESTLNATRLRANCWSVVKGPFELQFECEDELGAGASASGTESQTTTRALGRLRLFISFEAVRADLFLLLDLDDSGMLDSTEVAEASKTLLGIDQNQDGRIELGELGATKSLTIRRREFNGNEQSVRPITASIRRKDSDGPLWFLQMDSNRDRYIQSSEFLGSSAQFDKYDSNSDSRISETEASIATP